MKKFFKILFPTALIGMMFACEAELAPITIKPDPVFDKTGLYGTALQNHPQIPQPPPVPPQNSPDKCSARCRQ